MDVTGIDIQICRTGRRRGNIIRQATGTVWEDGFSRKERTGNGWIWIKG
ncbi:hypothetical protein IR083_03930 [Dysgonomonas sp. GY75]|nr:hypothetical protein [Dysgonomonas sp. GY75]MBF0647962.1 hypothetical protein [Dysgonomonas sp. GY75]